MIMIFHLKISDLLQMEYYFTKQCHYIAPILELDLSIIADHYVAIRILEAMGWEKEAREQLTYILSWYWKLKILGSQRFTYTDYLRMKLLFIREQANYQYIKFPLLAIKTMDSLQYCSRFFFKIIIYI
jgi:hypothetical protein